MCVTPLESTAIPVSGVDSLLEFTTVNDHDAADTTGVITNTMLIVKMTAIKVIDTFEFPPKPILERSIFTAFSPQATLAAAKAGCITYAII
jgi:hypothetical protein